MKTTDLATSLFNSFYSNHVLLYVGQQTTNEELKVLAKCKWSAIITSRKDPEFSQFFAVEGRTPLEYTRRNKIPNKPLHRKKTPILRLFGINGEQQDDGSDIWDDEANDFDFDIAHEFMSFLPSIMDYVNPLSVVGINSEVDLTIFGTSRFGRILQKSITDGAITFWGIPDASGGEQKELTALRKLSEIKSFPIYENSLTDIIDRRLTEVTVESNESTVLDLDNDIFYRGKVPISITQTDLIAIKNIGTLLTERTVYKIRPFGRIQCRQWFTNFLELSSSQGPQWYGYLPQSTFYVKRSFEDALTQLVRRLLFGRGIDNDNSDICPVILEGRPGSSKSVTLGALAYRIYNEKNCPVLYISNEQFLSQGFGTDFDLLCESLESLQDIGGVDSRILIIWDSSAYRSVIERVRELMKRLSNRGKRVVLVCSSYPQNNTLQVAKQCFHLQDSESGVFSKCSEEDADVVKRNGCYFVTATRDMTSREQNIFWQHTKDFSGISTTTISNMRKKLIDEGRTEIFDYYYMLISVLRDSLEKGLQTEQSKVFHYVKTELQSIIGRIAEGKVKSAQSNQMFQALINAGMSEEFLNSLTDTDEENAKTNTDMDTDYRLTRFNTCIAMFSRFKLDVPYSLAYSVLLDDAITEQFSAANRELFDVVTHEFPWLSYGENNEGEFVFRFLNPLEADIFLSNHDISGEEQVNVVCDILATFGEDYRKSQCYDRYLGDKLQMLLRLLGPNSNYTYRHEIEHRRILQKLDQLIDAILALKDVYGVPDYDCGFAAIVITFLREHYGHNWDIEHMSSSEEVHEYKFGTEFFMPEDYELRIGKLSQAITMAENGIEEISEHLHSDRALEWSGRAHLQQQMDSLAVESSLISMELDDVLEDYTKTCSLRQVKKQPNTRGQILPYTVVYRQLVSVIQHQPTNGYAYNALFKAYQKAYNQAKVCNNQDKQLLYLSEIMQIVEMCESHNSEILNRGGKTDELSIHLSQIRSDAAKLPISMDSILNRHEHARTTNPATEAFFALYDSMIEANNPAAITFICQKELKIPKDRKKLDDDTLRVCKKVLDFLTLEENYICVSSNAYAMAMLIRYSWMYFNKYILDGTSECQLTNINSEQWGTIYKYCTQYEAITAPNDRQPIIMLAYALAALHINGVSETGFSEAQKIINSIQEDSFFQPRMRTPYMICTNDGRPIKYGGTVIYTDNQKNNGQIRVHGIPQRLQNTPGVRFNRLTFGRKSKMPDMNRTFSDLEIAIGYTGFVVYNEVGRKERGGSD